MKVGSNQRPGSYGPIDSNVESENNTTNKKSTGINKPIDIMTNARTESWAADGKMTMGEVKGSEPQKKVFDWAITDEE